jgi:hypothetical protein
MTMTGAGARSAEEVGETLDEALGGAPWRAGEVLGVGVLVGLARLEEVSLG